MDEEHDGLLLASHVIEREMDAGTSSSRSFRKSEKKGTGHPLFGGISDQCNVC